MTQVEMGDGCKWVGVGGAGSVCRESPAWWSQTKNAMPLTLLCAQVVRHVWCGRGLVVVDVPCELGRCVLLQVLQGGRDLRTARTFPASRYPGYPTLSYFTRLCACAPYFGVLDLILMSVRINAHKL